MLNNNSFFYLQKILLEIVWDIIYFPIWWYTKGFIKNIIKAKNFLKNKEKTLALIVWIKNIHRPMYGQYDWTGIIISFFIRIFQIITKIIILLIWFILIIFLLLLWLTLPIFIIYEIIFQLI
jgi:hypothetical protein